MGYKVGVLLPPGIAEEVRRTGKQPWADMNPFHTKSFVSSVPFPTIRATVGGPSTFPASFLGTLPAHHSSISHPSLPPVIPQFRRAAVVPFKLRGAGRRWFGKLHFYRAHVGGGIIDRWISMAPTELNRTPHG